MEHKLRKPRIDAATTEGKVIQLISALNVLIDELNLTRNGSTDKVYLEGKDGDWTYKRWESGRAECHSSISITLPSWSEISGLLTATAESISPPLGLFKETPEIYLQINTDALISVCGIKTDKSAFAPSFIRFDGNNTSITLPLGVYAMGKWK